ncbi:MAG TPA: hypothetical protein VNC61_00335 [Acidimicrobiales bacterium]|nr:hypothetical protein [Acidimicrobiales bacterium]
MAIDPSLVREVLLADGWHAVAWRTGSGFTLTPYSYGDVARELPRYEEGFVLVERIDAKGMQHVIAGPLSSVLAVSYKTRAPRRAVDALNKKPGSTSH